MKKIAWIASAAVLAGASTLLAVQDELKFPEMPAPQQEHQWLQQFVGEWTTEAEMTMGPDQVFRSTGSESVRAVGGHWVVSDITGDSPMGPMHGVMTLGFDPEKDKFIGTWIDSMTSHLWVYEGTLDSTGKVLTLSTVGPDMMDPTPGKTANYRDVIEIKNPNTRVLTSSAQDANGEWQTFGTITFSRK